MPTLRQSDWEQFITAAQIKLPGASLTGIKSETFDVMKEFFKDSNAWTEDIAFTPVTGTVTYVLAPADNGQIIRLVGVWDDKGIPIPSFMPDFGVLQMVNPPQASAQGTGVTIQWTARVVKNVSLPTDNNDVPIAPDWTLRVYEDTILDGLLGRMMTQLEKTFSNSQQGVYHLKRFRAGINNARAAARKMNTIYAQDWAYPEGFTRGSQRGGVSTAWPTRAF